MQATRDPVERRIPARMLRTLLPLGRGAPERAVPLGQGVRPAVPPGRGFHGTGGSTGGSAGTGGSTGGSEERRSWDRGFDRRFRRDRGFAGGGKDASDALIEIDTRPPVDVSGPPESGANDGSLDARGPSESGANDGTVVGIDAPDVVPDASPNGIFCGSETCNPASQVCCAESGALNPQSTLPLRCVPKGMCSGMSPMNIPCDDHADCAISNPSLPVCCAGTSSGTPNGPFILFECTIPNGCVTTSSVRHVYMCSGPGDTTSCPGRHRLQVGPPARRILHLRVTDLTDRCRAVPWSLGAKSKRSRKPGYQ